MDFMGQRRTGGAKYGKNNKKVVVHDFFGWEQRTVSASTTSKSYLISPAASDSDRTTHRDVATRQPSSPSARTAPSAVRKAVLSPRSVPSSPPSGVKASSEQNEHSVYDMDSSDGDVATAKVIKRRRLESRPRSEPLAAQAVKEPLSRKPETSSVPEQVTQAKMLPTSSTMKASRITAKRSPIPTQTKPSFSKVVSRTATAKTPEKQSMKTQTKIVPKPISSFDIPIEDDLDPLLPLEAPQCDPDVKAGAVIERLSVVDSPVVGSSAKLSGNAIASPASNRVKKMRADPEAPARHEKSDVGLLAHKQKPTSRTRQRLLTGLDIVEKTIEVDDFPQSNDLAEDTKPVAQISVLPDPSISNARPAQIVRTDSSNGRRTYSRNQPTYRSREQSHLSHTVDDVDAMSITSSQDASQQIISQLTMQTQPSQLQMQLELDDDSSDDGAVANKLKSIHELRLAGTANRVEREVESLVEDMDPSNKSNSKSLRLQAIMKLIRKNMETAFINTLAQKYIDRLVSWSKSFSDELSLGLMHLALWQLVRHEQSSSMKLHILLDALIASAPTTVKSRASFTSLSKDRKQNLSKATSKDVVAFESEILSGAILPDLSGKQLSISVVTLGCMNSAIRSLLALGETQIFVPAECLASVVFLIRSRNVDDLIKDEISIKCVDDGLKAALSFLQLCSGPLDVDLNLDAEEYKQLAGSLSNLAGYTETSVLQAILHFVISLSNDKPSICSAIVSSRFGNTIMAATCTKFDSLLKDASNGHVLDQDELDSVILCLACMLNLTEHEDTARFKFSNGRSAGAMSSNIEQLTNLYNVLAPLLIGTKAAEMAQLLVTFGYLSLLICSLAREQSVRQQVTKLLEDKDMDDIIASAKEFLMHLHTVESQDTADIDVDESGLSQGMVDGFTRGFEQIIIELRSSQLRST